MYIPNYPEDSTLRRHFESAAAFRRQAWLTQPPTDSVLRRHHEQLRQIAASASRSPTPQQQTARPAAQPDDGGGLFGWLKRLFS